MIISLLQTKEQKFWKWFTKNSRELDKLDNSTIYEDLHKQLSKINPGLVYEVSAINKNRVREITISCDGIKNLIPVVKNLIRSAPEIKGWDEVAFRQPVGVDLTIEINGIKLSSDEIYFTYQKSLSGLVNLELFIKSLKDNNRDVYMSAVFILLDAAIGEYLMMTKIGSLDMQTMSDNAQSLQPLSELINIVSIS